MNLSNSSEHYLRQPEMLNPHLLKSSHSNIITQSKRRGKIISQLSNDLKLIIDHHLIKSNKIREAKYRTGSTFQLEIRIWNSEIEIQEGQGVLCITRNTKMHSKKKIDKTSLHSKKFPSFSHPFFN